VNTASPTRRRSRLYIDTSAYISILVSEHGHERLSRETQNAELLSSVLLILEARRNVIRLGREGTLDADECQRALERIDRESNGFVLRDLTIDLCDASPMPVLTTPRSLDLAHLRTALWFHAEAKLDRFVTVDANQRRAARELGLPI
jgi:hypothetical protein